MKHYHHRIEMMQDLPQGAVGAEVGVWRGYFSSQVLSETKIGRLYMVDSWKKRDGLYALDPVNREDHNANMQEAIANTKSFGLRAFIMPGESLEVAKLLSNLDFAYIDAAHDRESVYNDLMAWSKALKPGGVLMGHDFTDSPEAQAMQFGVMEAVICFCMDHNWEITGLTNESWASYKLEKK